MNMLLESLTMVADDPFAWGSVVLMGGFSVYAVYHRVTCPILRGDALPESMVAEARAAAREVPRPGWRFGLLMMAGIAATVTGLSFVASGPAPTIAFYLLLAGVFVIQTEPVRLQIREAQDRAAATQHSNPDDHHAAVARLRASHMWLVWLNFLLLGATGTALLAF
jgi:hypothetical protein